MAPLAKMVPDSCTKAMVHYICTCDTQLWHFVFVISSPTGRS